MVFSCAAVCTDLKTTRVPNGLIILGILAGVMLSLMGIRSGGVVLFLIRLIWPVALLYPIYLIRGLGAGDIKCFAALSVILGSRLALSVIIYSLIIGAVIGLCRWILRGQLKGRMYGMYAGLCQVLLYKQNSAYFTERGEKLHFTICIFFALVGCLLREGLK
ncbi:MAG: prepilin peptidase [Roseburia lenta]|nr:prepilin peptidase [Roseburia lenta]